MGLQKPPKSISGPTPPGDEEPQLTPRQCSVQSPSPAPHPMAPLSPLPYIRLVSVYTHFFSSLKSLLCPIKLSLTVRAQRPLHHPPPLTKLALGLGPPCSAFKYKVVSRAIIRSTFSLPRGSPQAFLITYNGLSLHLHRERLSQRPFMEEPRTGAMVLKLWRIGTPWRAIKEQEALGSRLRPGPKE